MSRQTSFATGEVDPRLYGASHLTQYGNGLRRCRNTIVSRQGSIYNRPGTAYVMTASGACRLVAFNYANGQNIVMVFSGLLVTFILNGQQIKNGGVPVTLATPYATADLKLLKFAQSGDVVTITHGSYAPYELKRLTIDNFSWSLIAVSMIANPTPGAAPMNADAWDQAADTSYPLRKWQWGYTYIDSNGLESMIGPLMCPPASTDVTKDQKAKRYSDLTPFHLMLSAATPAGPPAPVYNIYAGRNRILGLIGQSSNLRTSGAQIVDFEDNGDDPDFSQMSPTNVRDPFTTGAFQANTRYEEGEQVTAGGNVYMALNGGVSSAVAPSGTGSDIVTGTASAWQAAHLYAINDTVFNYGKTYICTVGGTSGAAPGPASEGSALLDGSTVTWTYVGWGEAVHWKYVQGAPAANRYPYCSGYFEQRRIFGGSDAFPTRLSCTRTGNYYNLTQQGLMVVESDPVIVDLAALRREEIRSMATLRTLLVFTSQGIWSFGGANGQALGPTAVDAHQQMRIGCSWLDPIIIGNICLFVTDTQNVVRDLSYQYLLQLYDGEDITVLARHLFDGHAITDWTFQQLPEGVTWLTREDGLLLGLTYDKAQKLLAWHWHDTGPLDGNGNATDDFMSICSVLEGQYNALYAVVLRNGQYMVERFANRVLPRLANGQVDRTQGVFLDCSATFTGSGITSVSVPQLAGRVVNMLADGAVYGPYTVAIDGSLDFSADCPQGAATVIVGLPFYAEGSLLPLVDPRADIRSNVKNLERVSIEVVDTCGLWVGPDFDHLKEWTQRQVSDSYGNPAPFTGLDHIRFPNGYDHDGGMAFRQVDPLPFTIVALGREIDVGGD